MKVDLDYILPCDVRLEPATVISKGCTLRTLLVALSVRETHEWQTMGDIGEWASRYRKAIADLNQMNDKGELP
jgi:hypothetical protein